MALRCLGLRPPRLPGSPQGRTRAEWLESGATPQDWIDATRYAMFSESRGRSLQLEKDGLEWTEAGPLRKIQEHQTLVNWPDLERGVQNAGATGLPLYSLRGLRHALCLKQPVLLAGDPSTTGSYGPSLGIDYQGGHIVLAIDYDGRYRIHDPLCLAGPIWLSCEETRAFCGARVLGDQIGLVVQPGSLRLSA